MYKAQMTKKLILLAIIWQHYFIILSHFYIIHLIPNCLVIKKQQLFVVFKMKVQYESNFGLRFF
jgi:hypothetical protein